MTAQFQTVNTQGTKKMKPFSTDENPDPEPNRLPQVKPVTGTGGTGTQTGTSDGSLNLVNNRTFDEGAQGERTRDPLGGTIPRDALGGTVQEPVPEEEEEEEEDTDEEVSPS